MVSYYWLDKFFPSIGLITITGPKNFWKSRIGYTSVGQILLENKVDPKGSSATRQLAQVLLELPEVSFVTFKDNIITISVVEGTTSQQAFEVAQIAIDNLSISKINA